MKRSLGSGIITRWYNYTPTIVGVGTATINYARYRRVGDMAEIDIGFTGGVHTGDVLRIGLPNNIAATKAPGLMLVGTCATTDATYFRCWVFQSNTQSISSAYLYNAGAALGSPLNGTSFANGTVFSAQFSMELAPWKGKTKRK